MNSVNISIDALENQESKDMPTNSNHDVVTYYNFLKYVNIKYKMSVVDLARIFEVERQTIYNYFSNHTNKLPNKVKRKVAAIYGAFTFEDALKKEKKVIDIESKYKLANKVLTTNEESIIDNDLLSQIYSIKYDRNNVIKVVLKNEFDFVRHWGIALHNATNASNIENELYTNSFKKIVSKNSIRYTQKLFDLLAEFDSNDTCLLDLIANEIKKKNEHGRYIGEVSHSKESIEQNILRVVSQNNSVIKLDYQDFDSIGKVYYHSKYYVQKATDSKIFIESEYANKAKEIILNITSNNSISIKDLSIIFDEVRSNFDDVDITFGSGVDDTNDGIIIDIFLGDGNKVK